MGASINVKDKDFLAAGTARRLVVILHGWTGSSAKMAEVKDLVREKMPDADIYVPDLPIANFFGTERAEIIVGQLVKAIDHRYSQRLYESIVLVGHSSGGVLVRKIFVAAWAAADDVNREGTHYDWAERIERIVFLAAVNRGWTTSSAVDYVSSVMWRLGIFWSYLRYRGRNTILQTARGAPFLVATRLQWLILMQDDTKKKAQDVLAVQLLGTLDDIVSPGDTVDYVADFQRDDGGANRFLLLELPQTGHFEAIEVDPELNWKERDIRLRRREIVAAALQSDAGTLVGSPHAIRREFLEDELPPQPNPAVTDVVFVIHGIRDRGFWTKKIARKIREHATDSDKVRCVTASYGYFPMAPFLLVWGRFGKVEWLMDLYCEVRAHYPNAKFSYVGHSNGTYLAAKALEDYPLTRFETVVFAGSVVRRNFPWKSFIDSGRVKRVLNYVATADWVVALFPGGLEPIRWFDLGGAGHRGFKARREPEEFNYIRGSHSAGVRESQWDAIARFVLHGEPPPNTEPDHSKKQSMLWVYAGKMATVILLAIVGFVAYFTYLIIHWTFVPGSTAWGVTMTVCLFAWLALLRVILTRF